MQYFGYIGLRLGVALLWLIPFPFLYRLSKGVAFLLDRIIGYRREVIFSNLKKCFPEKGREEIEAIARKSYLNLTDHMLEALKSFSMPVDKIRPRFIFKNPEAVNQFLEKGRPVILNGSHFNNWEWAVQTTSVDLKGTTIGINKPIRNKVVEKYVNNIRTRAGMRLVGMKSIFKFIKENPALPAAYLLLSDQSPGNRNPDRIYWIDFFGNETAWVQGADVLARKFDFPVIYQHVSRIKRGYYEIEYIPVCLDPREKIDGEITRDYVILLEKIIRECPENWLWSHKRWKYTRAEVES